MTSIHRGLLLSVLLGLLAMTSISAGGRPSDATGVARALEVASEHAAALTDLPGVVGAGVGLASNGSAAILVLTEGPGVRGIPGSLDGVAVVSRVSGEIYALARPDGKGKPPKGEDPPVDPTGRFDRPVPIGVSTGHPDITAGTIGARVTDGTDVYALSNNHVYANTNAASIGDAVIQPGTVDGGTSPADDIGALYDFEPISFVSDNAIDAAIALSSTGDLGKATPSDGYGTPRSATIAASLNLKVKKYGRTTGQTSGRVSGIGFTVNVNYGVGVAKFVNQIIVEPGDFSAGGDSGSLIVVDGKGKNKADDRRPVGLLFAGSAFITVANPIDEVLTRFGVTIDGE